MGEQRSDFQPLAPIIRMAPNGLPNGHGLGASTSALRGVALIAAKDAATAGDNLQVGPGAFALASGKYLNADVSYYLAPGCTISKATNRIIYDNVVPLTGVIGGAGVLSSDGDNASPAGSVIDLRNAATNLTVFCREIKTTDPNGGEAIYITGGATLSVIADKVTCIGYDTIINEGGNIYVRCQELSSVENECLEMNGGVNIINADIIHATNKLFQIGGGGEVRITSQLMYNETQANNSQGMAVEIQFFIGDVYVDCPDIRSFIGISSTGSNLIYFSDCRLDTTINDFPSIDITNGTLAFNGLVLNNMQITTAASQTYSISAVVASTITVLGTVTCNKAIHANVLFTGPGRVIAAGVLVYDGGVAANVLSLLKAADYSAMRTLLSLVPGTNVQAYSGNLASYAAIAPSATGQTLLAVASAAAGRNAIGATNGTFPASAVEGVTYTVYSAGTGPDITSTYGLMTFGTTSPTITIARAGTYLLMARALIQNSGIDGFASVTFKLRKTNGTPADLTGSSGSYPLTYGADTTSHVIQLPMLIYVATAGDVIELWGRDAGSNGLTASSCSLIAVQIATGTP